MIELPTADEPVVIAEGDCLDVLRAMPNGCVDAVVTDPPAGIAFMGKDWDENKGGRERWIEWLEVRLAECLRVTKPGGRLLCWAIPRTSHWTATAVEDAGWHIENKVYHLFGTGFPKGKSQLKPAAEEWVLARKPGGKVPPLGIDECRVQTEDSTRRTNLSEMRWSGGWTGDKSEYQTGSDLGRWPANVVHDGSPAILEAFAAFGGKGGGDNRGECNGKRPGGFGNVGHDSGESSPNGTVYGDTGTAARFFYCAKASQSERLIGERIGCVCPGGDACGGFICDEGRTKNTHPTVKAVELMRWLVKLIAPPGSLVLDPFAGSGTTGKACQMEGRRCLLVEREAEYVQIIRRRLFSAPTTKPQPSLFDD